MKALTEAGVGDTEEVLTGALPSGVEDADDEANGASTNEVTTSGVSKGEAGVWPVIVVVIAASGFIIDGCI